MADVKCTCVQKIFPPEKGDEIGYMVAAYKANDMDELPAGSKDARFKAVGFLLPTCKASSIVLHGNWTSEKNGECTMHVTSYDEDVPNIPASSAEFLMTLEECKQAEANRLVNIAGNDNPLAVLDSDPDLFEKAIKNKFTATTIRNEYLLRRTKKDVLFYLKENTSKNVSVDTLKEVALLAEDLNEVKTDPFRFSIESSLPYMAAKKIAKLNGVSYTCLRGVEAAVVDVLKQAEGQASGYAYEDTAVGNTFCTVEELKMKAASSVGLLQSDPIITDAISSLIQDDICICVKGMYVYRKPTADAEYGIAEELDRLMSAHIKELDVKYDIYAVENDKKIRLAPEQRNAVKVAMANPVTLLIGGPGTGKTTIEQVIIRCFRAHYDTPVVLVAPTGKAARRMSESTGEPASTVHKALNVSAGTEVIVTDTIIDAGLILIDEASMLDAQTCFALFKAIRTGTQVVIVGDTNQLPSVGAGNVLYELIESGMVPIAALETVYRQKAGSTIATNCARIKVGNPQLDYTETFEFREVETQEEAVEAVLAAYDEEMSKGLTIDDICLLSPFRRSTPTGVNQINPMIQGKVIQPDTPYLKYGEKVFYLGDRVMAMTNEDDVANGDCGYITKIDGTKFDVDFCDGRVVTYHKNSLRNFELAYAITIHKSQGAEFKVCIIVMMDEHKAMLKRNLIYTAVSRAKSKVILIGTSSALKTAIETEDVSKRQSRLGEILMSRKIKH